MRQQAATTAVRHTWELDSGSGQQRLTHSAQHSVGHSLQCNAHKAEASKQRENVVKDATRASGGREEVRTVGQWDESGRDTRRD